jgi:hypothetical protein
MVKDPQRNDKKLPLTEKAEGDMISASSKSAGENASD